MKIYKGGVFIKTIQIKRRLKHIYLCIVVYILRKRVFNF